MTRLQSVMMMSGTTTNDEGSLKVMEIDPTSALKEFRDSIDKLLEKNSGGGSVPS